MGTKQLREAFNDAAGPEATCTMALLDYVQQGGTEWQILSFYGSYADGTPFEVKSQRIRPNGSVEVAARETAQGMLQRRKPQ
jgi:hypothetical protein